MLILSRRIGASMIVDHDITVTILSITGNQVKLGIVAPKNITVDREEIYHKKYVGRSIPMQHSVGVAQSHC